MNVVFFCPQFPRQNIEFCRGLRQSGATVLGIGDEPYAALPDRLKTVLTEYYRVDDLEEYDPVLRAVGFFTHKYGKIDRFESLNEYWLELEARVRTDFNIYGTKNDFVYNLKHKSKMKAFFEKSGVATVRCQPFTDLKAAQEFVAQVGLPVVVKPDLGSGASQTYKLGSDLELTNFAHNKPSDVDFILEEYVDGVIQTFDGLVDSRGTVAFATSHLFEQSIMEVVNTDDHLYYFCLPRIDPEVEAAGRAILRAFDVRERFFHIELFRRRRDGKIIALEVNMRPPGAWMTDAINFTHDIDIYQEWANMVVLGRVGGPFTGKYHTAYASRKRHKTYAHPHEEIVKVFASQLVQQAPIEEVFSRAMGNSAYQFRAPELEEVRRIVEFVQAERA